MRKLINSVILHFQASFEYTSIRRWMNMLKRHPPLFGKFVQTSFESPKSVLRVLIDYRGDIVHPRLAISFLQTFLQRIKVWPPYILIERDAHQDFGEIVKSKVSSGLTKRAIQFYQDRRALPVSIHRMLPVEKILEQGLAFGSTISSWKVFQTVASEFLDPPIFNHRCVDSLSIQLPPQGILHRGLLLTQARIRVVSWSPSQIFQCQERRFIQGETRSFHQVQCVSHET